MIQQLKSAAINNVRVIVVTRPVEEFKLSDQNALRETLDLFERNGMRVVMKPNIHQKFAVFDQRIVWYGSINYLSYGNAEESVMRIESAHIANELLKSIEGRKAPDGGMETGRVSRAD